MILESLKDKKEIEAISADGGSRMNEHGGNTCFYAFVDLTWSFSRELLINLRIRNAMVWQLKTLPAIKCNVGLQDLNCQVASDVHKITLNRKLHHATIYFFHYQ